MKKHNFHSMSTTVEISYSETIFPFQIEAVIDSFQFIENICSRFKDNSELSKLNRKIGLNVRVSEEFLKILKSALFHYHETEGLFNPGILNALEIEGYNESIEKVVRRPLCKPRTLKSGSLNGEPYVLDEVNHSVRLNTKIDLGGIAKGWAVDQAVKQLESFGYGFINAGGDLMVFGALPRPLRIAVENPFDSEKVLSSIRIQSGSVATSSTIKRRWNLEGEWKNHLIDPKTGYSVKNNLASSTVTAPSCVQADIWAKIVLLLGEEKGIEWKKNKNEQAVLINLKGEVLEGIRL
ncbi:FAD:protein FMN transferase [Neobacillus sp. PS3-34]|uniref:FAD:protein FMN transferase n=1 Tax=Neobacillus sp. PS3-34 TaxID=3070678 RepID=UPI0027DF51CE|nr:FAD:protein FMN transferase [Neobacillus sp. PS3-34]WML48036.1 FAD:protein FMN transferase [Neobacillus sp. PS3-34]